MSEEEIINKVDKFIYTVTVILPTYSTKIPEYCIDEEAWIAIKGLLDLYNKEKEKNEKEQRRIYRFGYNNACNDIGKLNDKNFISKDKIKEKLENLPHWLIEEEVRGIKFFANELLEGNK